MRITIDREDVTKYVLYCNDTAWTPIEIVGNTLVYNVGNSGTFTLLDRQRAKVFEFSNSYEADFYIDSIYLYDETKPDKIGKLLSVNEYVQIKQKDARIPFIVKATSDISGLTVAGYHCGVRKLETELPAIYVAFLMEPTSFPAYANIGDVRVVFWENPWQ